MKIYWNALSLPELANLSPNDRHRIWMIAYRRGLRHWQTWLAILFAMFVMFIAALLAVALIPKDLGYMGLLYSALIGGIPTGLAFLFFSQVTIHMARPHLADLLEADGA